MRRFLFARLAAAVATTSLFGFSGVSCLGMPAAAGIGGLEVPVAWIGAWWILKRVPLPAGSLTRPDVLVLAVSLLLVFLVFVYR